ncbi:mannose-1-phosphate guanyltransferase alpha-B-like isoform X2 [Paramacrobiotus metropolitanus]|uniref:mannose-1-phosphate guanyltransferase alpha-B-like isoform X2 n=1 Tax=Paramacrobiotus metropolitanus TaxID=2943436 RepID=UPI0024460D0D|nr:mannose-1-phosphate guanyltransferase alpha-B-like isoform X2 [Paramacrobiotus metropolitanus]
MYVKAVILVGGPEKGTRFRPLSLDIPKPLFPVGGVPIIQHHIEACCKIRELKEILLIGYFPPNEFWNQFIAAQSHLHNVHIRYLQEFTALGTAGSIYHFRDQILFRGPDCVILMNGDVCADFRLDEMLKFHQQKQQASKALLTIMGTEALQTQSMNFGCIVENRETHEIRHYVEKPRTYVSSLVNCGVYILHPEIFTMIGDIIYGKLEPGAGDDYIDLYDVAGSRRSSLVRQASLGNSGAIPSELLSLEKDVITRLARAGGAFVYHTNGWWSQIKTAGSVIYANRHYLRLYHQTHPDRLAKSGPVIIGDVYIHESAKVHPSAVIGPNVSIHANVVIGAGTRIRDAVMLDDVVTADNCCILNAIVGWGSIVGSWARIEGTPNDPNPNKPFAKLEHTPLFSEKGFLNPSITILGANVSVPTELMVLNCIVLPRKDLAQNYKNQIIL